MLQGNTYNSAPERVLQSVKVNDMKVMKLSNQTSKVTGKYKTPEPQVGVKVCSGFQGFCLFFFHGLKAHLNFLCHKNIIYKLREQNVVAIDRFVMTSQRPCQYTKKSL